MGCCIYSPVKYRDNVLKWRRLQLKILTIAPPAHLRGGRFIWFIPQTAFRSDSPVIYHSVVRPPITTNHSHLHTPIARLLARKPTSDSSQS